MLKRKIYNVATWIWYKVFRHPIRLKVVYDNRHKRPTLTVVFLHGISATSTTWSNTLKEFANDPDLAQVRLAALDLLGFGKSLKADWLDYDYFEYNQALDKTLKKLKTQSPIMLVGHSMGSLIAANYIVNFHPSVDIIRTCLVSPPVLMAAEMARLPDAIYTKSYGSLFQLANDIPAMAVIARIVQRFSSFRSDYLKTAAFAKSMDNIILCRQNYQTFTKIRIPTLLVHGHFDALVMGSNLRRVASQNPTYVRYASVIGHHDISVGKRAKILLEIKRALKDAKQNQVI